MVSELASTMATLCTLGSLPVVYKFLPFYKITSPSTKRFTIYYHNSFAF